MHLNSGSPVIIPQLSGSSASDGDVCLTVPFYAIQCVATPMIFGPDHARQPVNILTISLFGKRPQYAYNLCQSVNSRLKTIKRIAFPYPDIVLIARETFTSSYASLSNPKSTRGILCTFDARYGIYGNHGIEETLFLPSQTGFPQ